MHSQMPASIKKTRSVSTLGSTSEPQVTVATEHVTDNEDELYGLIEGHGLPRTMR